MWFMGMSVTSRVKVTPSIHSVVNPRVWFNLDAQHKIPLETARGYLVPE